YVSGDYLLIETNHEIAFELLKKSAQREEIRKAVQEITGKVYKLGPYKLPEKKVSKDDVLDNFINRLKTSGVNVTEE
ncbi:MAG TPA: DNA polymerase III subunit gamma/tau, partial [Ruminococcaceae bacterium]|nr:DNA polymerase III subunit gamma/tau [Oscillospiraceae bacterium]